MDSGAASSRGASEDYDNLCKFRELFSGRFDDKEAAFLLESFEGDLGEATRFVLTSESAVVRQKIEEERSSWQTVQIRKPNKREKEELIGKIDRVKTTPSIFNRVKAGCIDTSARLFACQPCDNVWWRRIPERKKVSKCNKCKVRYDPVPRAKEWGWGIFKCPHCQHDFGSFCGVWQSCPCYNCGRMVRPSYIQPPSPGNHQRKTRNTHRCSGCRDCQPPGMAAGFGRGAAPAQNLPLMWDIGMPTFPSLNVDNDNLRHVADLRNTGPGSEVDYDAPPEGDDNSEGELPMSCVHPSSRRGSGQPIVIVPSRPHDSTGSTVDTFLDQGDFSKNYETLLETIDELDDSDH